MYIYMHIHNFQKAVWQHVDTWSCPKCIYRKLSLLLTQLISSTEKLTLDILKHLTLVTMLIQNPSHEKHKVPTQSVDDAH